MSADLITVLITNERGGQVFFLPRDEWARLERDFASYRASDHPRAGSYRHWLPREEPGAKARARLWRRLSGRERTGQLDLEFAGASIISGQ